jgi:hypothetical protein
MPHFVLIARDRPESFAHLSPAEMEGILQRYMAWGEALVEAGHWESGQKLAEGVGCVMGPGGSVTDGPYAESKEVVGGFWILEARDLDQARELAADCPHLEFGTLEIRAVDTMGEEEGETAPVSAANPEAVAGDAGR